MEKSGCELSCRRLGEKNLVNTANPGVANCCRQGACSAAHKNLGRGPNRSNLVRAGRPYKRANMLRSAGRRTTDAVSLYSAQRSYGAVL